MSLCEKVLDFLDAYSGIYGGNSAAMAVDGCARDMTYSCAVAAMQVKEKKNELQMDGRFNKNRKTIGNR